MIGCDCRFGEYVRFTPSLSEFVVLPEDSGYKEPQIFRPSENTLWRIYDNDEGFVQLISARSIGSVTLGGQVGYAKAVATLDRACVMRMEIRFIRRKGDAWEGRSEVFRSLICQHVRQRA